MGYQQFDVNSTEIQMILTIKLLQLQQSVLPELRYNVLEEYVANTIFSEDKTYCLSEAAEQILSIVPEDLLTYGTKVARVAVRRQALEELINAIEGV